MSPGQNRAKKVNVLIWKKLFKVNSEQSVARDLLPVREQRERSISWTCVWDMSLYPHDYNRYGGWDGFATIYNPSSIELHL